MSHVSTATPPRARRGSVLLAFVMAVSAFAGLPAAHAASCAGAHDGGDWPSHGGDLQGTRSQALEHSISAANATNLGSKWSFSLVKAGSKGHIQTIPIVAGGCVYVQVSDGDSAIYALNAADGSLVWTHKLGSSGCHDAPVVHDGVVYVNDPTDFAATGKGPHLLALDALTGDELFTGQTVATEKATGANAGCAAPAAFFDGYVLIGITNGENEPGAFGGFAIVRASDGSLVKRTHTVSDEEAANGYGGCSIWSAFSIDPDTKTGYTGTAQPGGWTTDHESERCNALIKIDLDSSSPTFGDIVDSVKGTPDDPPYIDVDFGSAPTMVKDSIGRTMVAQLEKSGVLHAARTRNMTHAWALNVSPVGAALGNYTASASDGSNVYTVGAYPGQLFSVNGSTGAANWVTPVVSPIATNSVAYANGVVYYADEKGFLNAFDATNGLPVFAHPMAADNQDCGRNQSGGVAVARNMVFAVCGPVLDAFGL